MIEYYNILVYKGANILMRIFFTYSARIRCWSPYQTPDTLFKGNAVNLVFFSSPMVCACYDLGEFVMLFAWSKKRF